jgi:multiple sugar transport system permease protein/putative aldouronate transport system permease protein
MNKNSDKRDILFNINAIFLFLLFTFICVYPFYNLLINTISDRKLVNLGRIIFLPEGINFDNYIEIFRIQNLSRAAMISAVRTLTGTAMNLFCTSYLAYFFTKQDMWGRKVWYRLVVVTMYFSAGLIPVYLNNRMLGLTNTFWIYIIPGLISVYNMILVKTSIEAMPPDLEESAYLDGAGYFRRYFRIVLPLQKPILATVALFTAVGHWNDFFTTKLYITNTRLYTMQFLLYEMLNQVKAASEQIVADNPYATITPVGIRLTLTAVVVIPVMLVYPFIQRYYVKGIMVGAVKG